MADSVVINAGPLITLARADALVVAAKLPLEFLCPIQVRDELDAGVACGYPAVDVAWLRVEPLSVGVHPLSLSRTALDEGEAAVIMLVLERGIPLVCIDDWKGRRATMAVGLRVTGTLGLLGLSALNDVAVEGPFPPPTPQ